MPRIRLEPLGVEVLADCGETVLDAFAAEGFFWPIGCDKIGECTNCSLEVISGMARLSQMGRYERSNLHRQRGQQSTDDPRLRLACQARIEGDIVVFKRGVRLESEFSA